MVMMIIITMLQQNHLKILKLFVITCLFTEAKKFAQKKILLTKILKINIY